MCLKQEPNYINKEARRFLQANIRNGQSATHKKLMRYIKTYELTYYR